MSEMWNRYYERTKALLPHGETVDAVALLEVTRSSAGLMALELGSGAGRDVRYLLGRGMIVTAVDADPNSVRLLNEEFQGGNLTAIQSRYDEFTYGEYDFITSQYALSFSPPETFHTVISSIVGSLASGGLLSVNIFGERDGWSGNAKMTFLSEDEIRKALADLTIVKLEEIERDDNLADGSAKHWHYFDILATK